MSHRPPLAQPNPDSATSVESNRTEPGRIWPITWIAIGAGVMTVLTLTAALLGFFDRSATAISSPAPSTAPSSTATGKPETADSKWVQDLWGPSGETATADSSRKWWEGDPIVDERSATPKTTTTATEHPPVAPPRSASAPAGSKIVWDDESIGDVTPKQSRQALSAEDLYDRIAPSVVTIKINDERGHHIGTGSGFLVDDNLLHRMYRRDFLEWDKGYAEIETKYSGPHRVGYLITNYHVIRPAVSADVLLVNGDEESVRWVIAEDEKADLALLLVVATSNKPFNGIPLALDDPRVGATVYAIGSPKGLDSSLSQGIVSGFRELSSDQRWLQTTAAISPGSSGGPLLLTDGTLAGVTTSGLDEAQNVNFAIPVSKVRKFLSTNARRREIAEGASLSWHEDAAFADLEVARTLLPRYTAGEKNAAAMLENARQEINAGTRDETGQKMKHYEQAAALAERAQESLPEEFKYLAHYVIGKANVWLAWQASMSGKSVDEMQARYSATGHSKSALHHFVQATKLKSDFSPAFEWLVTHHRSAGNWPEALLASDALVKLMPRCARALQLRGDCYHELNRLDSARDDLEAAIELAPRTGELYSALASVYLGLNDYGQAISCYERALELKYVPSMVHFNLGLTYRRVGQFEKAISEFEQARAAGMPSALCDQEIAKCKQRQR